MNERYPKGEALYQRARRVIPGGVFGFHKLIDDNSYPSFMQRGEGAWIEDVDGFRYIDYVLGKGPMILGYAHPAVTTAVQEQVTRGNMLSTTTADVPIVAELLLRFFPAMEKVRFHKTGSDAASAAVRLARAATGKNHIVSAGYHGWHDWCNPDCDGVPASRGRFFPFHYDLKRLEQLLTEHGDQIAAVILEPLPGFLSDAFYRQVGEWCRAHGCLLVLDEIKSGLRFADGGVQARHNITPDMTLVSKAIANGFCLSAVLGRSDLLDLSEHNHISSTFDIEAIPFAAARATLAVLAQADVLPQLAQTGLDLVDQLNQCFAHARLPLKAFGSGPMWRIAFADAEMEQQFYRETVARGLFLYPYDNQFLSTAHDAATVTDTVNAVAAALTHCQQGPSSRLDYKAVADRRLHEFPHRKGFLAGAPGPDGR